ncbi:hypothetical protein PQX77_006121 [Marasmius sp. AFHP31]|nr:hypothetical protein PQX77_006121 [Marasmius sp. AFHP31]
MNPLQALSTTMFSSAKDADGNGAPVNLDTYGFGTQSSSVCPDSPARQFRGATAFRRLALEVESAEAISSLERFETELPEEDRR